MNQKSSETSSGTSPDYSTGLNCQMEHHQRGRGCGWMNCPYCKQDYWLGRVEGSDIYHHWPDAEHMYHVHCATKEHTLVMNAIDHGMSKLVTYFNQNWERLKAENKLWRRPEMQMLSRLLR